MSAATIDRLLRPERQKYQLKGRSHTRPGTLLKPQIPMRTFTEWDEQQPGFLEIDLVSHDGGVIDSHHGFTLNSVDIASGWNSSTALKNKAQVWTLDGVQKLRAKLPFPLLGIDSDNGAEFINQRLYDFCQEHKIAFTRSRPYRKNDSCFVEQKNYSVVRRAVGYQRFDTEEQFRLLNQLYESLDLYTNFFQAQLKRQIEGLQRKLLATAVASRCLAKASMLNQAHPNRLWKWRARGKRQKASLPSSAWKSQAKSRLTFPHSLSPCG